MTKSKLRTKLQTNVLFVCLFVCLFFVKLVRLFPEEVRPRLTAKYWRNIRHVNPVVLSAFSPAIAIFLEFL